MRDIRSKGGKTTADLGILAAALYKVDWKIDDLEPDKQLLFQWCIEHKLRRKDAKDEFEEDEDEFIEFLSDLRNSRVEGGKKGSKTTNEYVLLQQLLIM